MIWGKNIPCYFWYDVLWWCNAAKQSCQLSAEVPHHYLMILMSWSRRTQTRRRTVLNLDFERWRHVVLLSKSCVRGLCDIFVVVSYIRQKLKKISFHSLQLPLPPITILLQLHLTHRVNYPWNLSNNPHNPSPSHILPLTWEKKMKKKKSAFFSPPPPPPETFTRINNNNNN